MTTATKYRRAARRAAAAPVDSVLQRLTQHEPGVYLVISCYLKLEPRDRARGKYLIKLKNRVRQHQQALAGMGLARDVQDAAHKDLDRVLEHLRSPVNLPSTQGIAIFACGPAKLFETVPVPTVHRSRIAVDRSPLVRELAAALDRFGRLYTAVFDRNVGRIFEVTASSAVERGDVAGGATRGKRYHPDEDAPGWGEFSFNNRIREEKQRHYEDIARQLSLWDRRSPARGIVLAGIGPEAGAVAPFLTNGLREKVFGTVRLTPREATPAVVYAASIEMSAEHDRQVERELIGEMKERLGEGWAVNGLHDTLRALGRGQVRTLLVQPDAAEAGFRCETTGRLVLDARECRGEGDPAPVLDLIDDAIEDALRQGVEVNVVHDSDAAASIDGLAALLRFR